MATSQHVCLDEVVSYFDQLEDPRSTINQKHPLVSVVVIAMMAVLAGAGGPTAIAKWAIRTCFVEPSSIIDIRPWRAGSFGQWAPTRSRNRRLIS